MRSEGSEDGDVPNIQKIKIRVEFFSFCYIMSIFDWRFGSGRGIVSDDNQKDRRNVLRAFGVLKIGFVTIGSILLGFSIGYYIDAKLQIEAPVFMIIFMILGIAGGYYAAYREIMKIVK